MRRMIPDNQWKNVKSNVEALVGGLSTDNASTKKIYCHPISITSADSNTSYRFRVSLMVFSQQATPYTLTTFKEWLDNLYTQVGATIRINVSGIVNNLIANVLYIPSWLFKSSETFYGFGGMVIDGSSAGGPTDSWDMFFSGATFNDGVNAIN